MSDMHLFFSFTLMPGRAHRWSASWKERLPHIDHSPMEDGEEQHTSDGVYRKRFQAYAENKQRIERTIKRPNV